MKNIPINKWWMSRITQPHVEPPPIPLIKEKHDGKSDKYFVKLKLCRDLTSPTSDIYELKISLFENRKPEEFFLFVSNFNMTLEASSTMDVGTDFWCPRNLFRREALRQFDLFSADVKSTETLNVDYIIRGLAQYFPPVNLLSKQKRAMRRGIKKPCSLTVRCYYCSWFQVKLTFTWNPHTPCINGNVNTVTYPRLDSGCQFSGHKYVEVYIK